MGTSIYDRVKARADEEKLTISALEMKAGVANGTIGGWRTGKPLAETLQKVASALECDINELLGESSK